jgi:hypothetical protein
VFKHTNPGLRAVTLEQDYDLFAFVCMNVFDLPYLSAIKNWRARARKAVCYLVEIYESRTAEAAFLLGLLRDFDEVCICYAGSVDAVQRIVGRPVHHVPLAVDTLRFTPLPRPEPRVVDVYAMGRTLPWTHDALRDLAARHKAFYIHDTIPGSLIRPTDHRQHRDLVANIAKRSRYFMTYPAKAGSDEPGQQSEVGARFYEGAAAGTVMIGQAPLSPTFARDFGWPDAVINVADEADLERLLHQGKQEPDPWAALRTRNAVEALRRHDWVYRWRRILELTGLPPTEEHLARERALETLARAPGSAP